MPQVTRRAIGSMFNVYETDMALGLAFKSAIFATMLQDRMISRISNTARPISRYKPATLSSLQLFSFFFFYENGIT